MKKYILAFILLTTTLSAFFILQRPKERIQNAVSEIKQINAAPRPDRPNTLRIPSINVTVPIESVGLDKAGLMDVPKNIYNTGWYSLGVRPGENGNAVIDGHVDTPDGTPSVFYNLKNLQKNDDIIIVDASGGEYHFKVLYVKIYKTEEFPVSEVFGKYAKSRLNLITCGGVWDKKKQNYTNRIVVFSEKVSI